ncbi:RecF/RecN/SMC protein, partial [Hanseniaspora valbyensis NRRL Y-1626]
MNENTTTPTKGEKNSLKKRKVALTTPPKQRKFSDDDITTETILRSPHKQSSTFFNSSHNHYQNFQINSDSNPSSRGRSHTSTETGTQIKTQEVSPYRKLSPARKGRSESPTSTGRRLSLVQLSPRRKNNKLQQLNHAIQRETVNQQTGGRRLYIHKLTLTNFKSYANEQVIGPFNENFTAVVGPNGSGKSNVIDSMLFVFGFRANKLRQGKLSELIHKSETFTDLNFCKENEELIVTRKAFKNNSSKYYVNNKESTYTKVTELLKKEGIDLDHKRFLILQGEVESIAQMKPKAEREGDDGILEYLEDIIGTSNYKAEIETSLTQLEELNDICVEKDNRLKIVEREMNSLEASKDSSIEYLRLEREYIILKGNYYQHNKFSINDKLNIIEQERSLKLEQQLKNNKEEQKKLKSLISDLKKSMSKNTMTLQRLENESKIADEHITSISNKKIGAEENKKNHQKTQQKNKVNFETAKKNFDIALKEIEESKKDIETALLKMTSLTENINVEKETYETERASLQKKSVHLTQQITILEQEWEPSEQKIEQLKTDSTLKSQEIELLKKKSKLDEITKQKDKLSKTIIEEDKLLSNLKIRDVYESLKVLDCLPSVRDKLIENDVVMESEDENNDIEEDSNDKMEIEEEEERENIKEEKHVDNMKIEEHGDNNTMEISEKTDKPESTTPPSRSISHIDYLKLHLLTIEESNQINKESLENEIALIKEKLDASSVNILTLEDYVIKFKSFKEKEKELADAVKNRDTVKEKSEQLKKQRYDQFMEGFNIISQSLKEMYQMITMGGNAELELVDSIDPFSEGILFSVMPPKKSWRNISNLSGGEKTLSSLALVFALHNYKPTPIYIMDEIDAALDFKNVSIVANYIKDRTKDAQFIVISLRNNMFELSERL